MDSTHARRSALERAFNREHEERVKELESESAVVSVALEKSERVAAEAREEVHRLRDEVSDATQRLCDVSEALETVRAESEGLRAQRDSALLVREALAAMIETRDSELECANATIAGLRAQLQNAVDAKCDGMLKTKGALSRAVEDRYRELRSERDTVDDAARLQLLDEELHRRSAELHQVRTDYESLKSDYERRFDRLGGELDVAHVKVTKLEDAKEGFRRRVVELEHELADHMEKANRNAEERDSELVAKTKIVDLYKSAQEDSNRKNEELTRSVNELKQLLEEANDRYETLQGDFKRSTEELKSIINNKDESIAALKRELENANELLKIVDDDNTIGNIEELSPSAAIASRFVRSRMSLTQAYDRIVRLSEELAIEKNEKKRLSQTLTAIVSELEEKAPLVEQQKMQFEEYADMNAQLTRQIELLSSDYDRLKDEAGENAKLSRRYQKENAQCKREIEDLGRQICFLLKEIDIAKGKRRPYDNGDVSRFNLSCESNASEMITENLVTFGDIDELQSNNRKLLKMVRDLTDKQEEVDKKDERMERDDIDNKLETLQKRVTELTDAQDRQVKMINNLVRQRDSYKKLCDERNQSLSNIDECDVSMDSSKKELEKVNGGNFQYLEVLETQLANSRKEMEYEKDKYRMFVEKSKVNELKLVQMHDSVLKQLNELHSKYAKCLSSSESLTEKCKVLEMNLSTSKREIVSLNEKINSYAHLTGKQESSIKKIHDELSISRNKLIQAESLINSIQTEHANLMNPSKSPKSDINNSKTSQELSFALKNIESLKTTIENSDSDQYEKLQFTLEEANRTYSTLRCMLQVEQSKYCDLTSYLKEEMEQYKHKINSEQDVIEKLKTELSEVKRELQAKSILVRELSSKSSYFDKNTANGDRDGNSSIDLDPHAINQSDDVQILKQQLEISRIHIEKYCNIYEKSERDLKTVSESFNKYKQQMDAQLESSKQNESCLQETCADLEKKLATLSDDVSTMQNKINIITNELSEKDVALNKAISDIAVLSSTLQAAEDRYANEIVLHSGDIQALADSKQQLLEMKEQFSNIERIKSELETILKENQVSWKNQEEMLTRENIELKNQLLDLNNQNSILHDQIHNISTKLTSSTASKTADNSADLSLSENTLNYTMDEIELKSSEQLLKIIRYLRRERDILVTKFEFMEAENKRIKSQLENTETQLDDAKLTSVEKNKVDVLATKHTGVIRKVETLNAMSDCFIDLRKERDNLHTKVQDVTEKYNTLSDNVIILRESNSELSAKIDMLQGENESFRMEIDKWKSMANSLIEKDDSVGIDDFKKLQNERETLSKSLSIEKEIVKKLTEDNTKLKSEKSQFENQVEYLSKQQSSLSENLKKKLTELMTLKKDFDQTNKEIAECKSVIVEKTKEINDMNAKLATNETVIADIQTKEAQVRKIGKRYKTQYEELLKTVEEEKKKSAALVTEAAATSENHLETCKVLEQKNMDLERNHEEKLNTLKTQITSCAEENKTLHKEIDSLKTSNQDMEEKAKQLLKQAKAKIIILNEAKENLGKELAEAKIKLEVFEQNKDENDVRLSLLKSQYDGRMAKLEKEKIALLQEKQNEITQLNKQIESLLQKINNQIPKSSISNTQNEKLSAEPPTANIKPMAGVSQRDNSRRVSGETPLASIRPMASHTAVRTAAVLPTTAQVSTHAVIQAPHTTGNVTNDILSSSSNSHATEFLPSSSSLGSRLHPQHSRHISLPSAESTQDIDTEVSVGSDTSSVSANVPVVPQSLNPSQMGSQAVALVMPRMETSTVEAQTLHPHQQQASSSSSSSSNLNSTVTTSHGPMGDSNSLGNKTELHRAFKRPRVASAQPQQKTILKRPKIQGFPRITENETDYQMPTSSQRDQEDDMVGFGDSEDEDSYQVTAYGLEDEENDDDKERPVETRITTESNISEDQEATGSNNEADIVDDTSQEIRSSVRDDNTSRRCDESRPGDHAGSIASVAHVQEQQIETISSGSAGGTYEDGDDSIVPSTPNLYIQKRNEGESGTSSAGVLLEDNNADVTQQISAHDATGISTNNANAQSSEAEAGGVNNSTIDDESPTVSSQSTTTSFVPQIEEGREAEASSTGNNVMRGLWRMGRGMVNRRGGSMSPQMHNQRTPDQRPSPIVWNSDGNNRRGQFPQQRGLPRGGRHVLRRPPNFYKRF